MNSSSNSVHRNGTIGCLLGPAVASILLLGQAQVASAVAVSVWVNDQDNGWQQIASDPGGLLAVVASYTTVNGKFTLTADSASTSGPNAKLDSSTFHIQHNDGGTERLQIAVIGTGFTAPTLAPISVTSQVSGANGQGVLTSLTFESYVDPTNNGNPALLAGGQGLQIPTLFPSIGGPGANQNTTIVSNLSSPFSVAELSALTMTGSGFIVTFDGDTTLNNVPEPSSITLFGICFTVLAGYGYGRKRRRRQLLRP